MKITADRAALRAAFNLVGPVVPARSPSDVMKNAKLIVTPTGTELIALNEAMGIRATVGGVTVLRPGECLLAPDRILAILASSPDKVLEIESDDNSIHVRGARSKYRIPTENPDLFPFVPGFDVESYVHIWANEFRSLIRRTAFATEKFKPNSVTAGVLWETDAEQMRMVACSSVGMAYAQASIDSEDGTPAYVNLHAKYPAPVVPLASVKFLERVIPDDENVDVHLSFADKGSVLIHVDGVATISSRCLEGRFQQYQQARAKSLVGGHSVLMEGGELRATIEQASVATSEESRGVHFVFSDGVLRLSCQSEAAGNSEVEMPIEYDGPPFRVVLDPTKGLLDMLRVVGDPTQVTFRVLESPQRVSVTTDDGTFYAVATMDLRPPQTAGGPS